MPKIHQKEIVRLEIDEVASLLDEVEQGDKLTNKEKHFHEDNLFTLRKIKKLYILSLF